MIERSTPVSPADDSPPRHRSALRGASIVLGQAILTAVVLYFFVLDGRHRDIRVPFHFSIDTLQALMQSKSTLDNGWWWSNSMLGAPFTFDALAFPANSNVDQAIVWVVGRFIGNPLAAVNVAWMVMVVLSGLTATWCMRKLGASTVSSMVAGTLFALSPYALYRNLGHFWLVIYLVPFPCTAALLLASGRPPERWFWKGCGGLIAGCVLLSFDYVYYPFFACFCIGIAALAGCLTHRDARILGAGAICVALIASGTLLNLAPSLYSWSRHGRPIILHDKTPAESEVYGLKIRQLITPLRHHVFAPFRNFAEREAAAQFPLETENVTSRLGLVGTLGFLGLLGLLFVPGATDRLNNRKTLLGASQLTIAAVLLATIGGFGSLFALAVSPEIRAYNRICPFIEFFALTAIALAMDSLFKTRHGRIVAAVTVLALGLIDQRTAGVNVRVAYAGIAAEIPPLETFVRQLESRLPDRAMVLQLPFRTYLNDEGIARMGTYDHLRLYLVSHKIRWSYPALSNDQVRWQQAAARLDPRDLPSRMAAEGFAAMVIDRYGYGDGGFAVIAATIAGASDARILAQNGRYIALDIRRSEAPGPATTALAACPGTVLAAIDQIGVISASLQGDRLHVPGSHEFSPTGWAVDQRTGQASKDVDVLIDRRIFRSVYGIFRDDVALYFKRDAYLPTGFTAAIPMEGFSKGRHALALRVVAPDGTCYYQTPTVGLVVD
jgi:phosphoglycerol transferase